jgi:hypothetical protein
MELRIIGDLFGVSAYQAPYIGGEPQAVSIALISGAVRL